MGDQCPVNVDLDGLLKLSRATPRKRGDGTSIRAWRPGLPHEDRDTTRVSCKSFRVRYRAILALGSWLLLPSNPTSGWRFRHAIVRLRRHILHAYGTGVRSRRQHSKDAGDA
jgi:hypothetical protein